MRWDSHLQHVLGRIAPAVLVWIILLPGSGISGTGPADPYTILQKHYEASGGLARVKAVKTMYTEGTTAYDGLTGRFRSWECHPLQYRLEEDFTVIFQVQGDDGQVSWRKDTNGKVTVLRDDQTVKRRTIARHYENFEHIDPEAPFFKISHEGIRQVDGHQCHVIAIRNQLNQDVQWHFIDQTSFQMIKTIEQHPDMEIHTRYSDYRNVNGLLFPFHDESRIIPRQKKEIRQIEKCIINPVIEPSRFRIPEDTPPDYRFDVGNRSAEIPFRLIGNLIFLDVAIGDIKRPWILDSGASMSIIDEQFALDLGLRPQGTIKGYGFGANFDLQFVTLPGFRLPGVTFSKQTIFAFRNFAENFQETPCFGILGYDFLSRFVVKIDYAARRMSLFRPADFTYSGNGIVIEAPLKNGVFTLPVTVDDIYTGLWSLDLGSFNTSFHYPFAKANNLFQKKGVYHLSRGLGGEYLEKTIQFNTLQVGTMVLGNPLISVPDTKGPGATATAELIGNIGNATLRHFTVYLMYETQQLILKPGGDFRTNFPRNNSGLQIARTDQGNPCIVYISPGSPGEKAGLATGDIIQAINTAKFNRNSELEAIRNLLTQQPGTVLHLQILRNRQKQDLKLILENLYPQ